MTATIRPGHLGDIYHVEALGRRALEEAGHLADGYDPAAVLAQAVDSLKKGLVYFAEIDHEEVDVESRSVTVSPMIIGAIVIGLTAWPHAPDATMITNEHLYVLPEHRATKTANGVSVGRALLDVMCRMSDQYGVKALFRASYGENPDAIEALVKRAGFKPLGVFALYEPVVAVAEKTDTSEAGHGRQQDDDEGREQAA